ncbi:hypothetical protein IMSAG192_01076 [Muribaculaceae bacterium]|nr:hypothetical protein IMSAG192_01076 [Muribaculaceae bacterium]
MYILRRSQVCSLSSELSIAWNMASPRSSCFLALKRRLLLIIRAMATMATSIMTGAPPQCMRAAMMAAPMNATAAVINHPPITDITPVMRNTALSRLHARSDSDVPMATMNVTKVVERGSFMEVPAAISIPASMRLTEPRMRSNEAPCSA